MAEQSLAVWSPAAAWAGIAEPGRSGRADRAAGVMVERLEGLALASVIVGPDGASAFAARALAGYGVTPPTTPRIAEGREVAFIWSGPNQWLALSERPGLATRLQAELGDLAAIADQSDARAVLRLGGQQVPAALAKGCSLDLHPATFPPGTAALTAIAHIGVQLWLGDDGCFRVAVPRSYAGSFWSWLAASAAEFGMEVA